MTWTRRDSGVPTRPKNPQQAAGSRAVEERAVDSLCPTDSCPEELDPGLPGSCTPQAEAWELEGSARVPETFRGNLAGSHVLQAKGGCQPQQH